MHLRARKIRGSRKMTCKTWASNPFFITATNQLPPPETVVFACIEPAENI